MGRDSKISWTNHTWNPWIGCKKVSAGCEHCYMYRDVSRRGGDPTDIHRAADRTFHSPLRWRDPALVFTCSWSDFFLFEADAWRDEAWKIIRSTPHLTYQILTKRPGRIPFCLPADWGSGYPNVWLGVTIEDQRTLSRGWLLRAMPMNVLRFVSYEPAIGPVDWTELLSLKVGRDMPDLGDDIGGPIGWLISGGESGPDARPADPDWFRAARDACAAAGIPFFHKQNGARIRMHDTWGGDWLDDKQHHEIPPRFRLHPQQGRLLDG